MVDRIVKIKLDADATSAVKGFAALQDAAGETRAKIAASAQSQRQEWATVGKGLTAAGVAITGLGVAAMKTGIEYNTLQQTSRAALTTILGSAQAANAQMDKLDAFARNSPFAKQTFITAQQQMLAFGIETQKVIPYLDALQNAVAASGGSNQDIAELAEIFGKVQSAAKITSVDLQMFGRRGVNAAELIGAQMGKTGAEIRSEITAGTLDASKALDALAKGMDQKYSGAAANVKNTFAGAMDRVKAAWRDFAAELAKPLVDPNGGGALVDLLNWAADAMRAFEDLPGPVKGTVTALTGLVGVGSLAAGTFMLALPKVLEFSAALKSLGGIAGIAKGGLGGIASFLTSPWVLALTAAVLSVVALNKAVEAGKTPQSEFGVALKQTTNLVDALQIATRNTKSNYWTDGFRDSLKDLPGLMDRVMKANDDLMTMTGFADQKALDNLRQMGVELATVAQVDFASVQKSFNDLVADMDELQVEELLNQMPELRAEFVNAAQAIGLAGSEGDVLSLAMGDIDYAAERSAKSLEGMAGVATDVTDAIARLGDEISNFGNAQIDADRAAIAFEEKLASLTEIVESGTGALGTMSDEGRKTESAMLDLVNAAGRSADAILKSNGSQEEAIEVLSRARQTLIEHRMALGDDVHVAAAWADQRLASSKIVSDSFDQINRSAGNIPRDIGVTVTAETASAQAAIDAWISQNSGRQIGVVLGVAAAAVAGGKAYGGTIGFAGGGTIPGLAGGGTTPRRHLAGLNGGVMDGTVYGAGTGKSDSVLVALSRGEEVIQEPYASMFRPELKAMNQGVYLPSTPPPVIVQAPAGAGSGGVHIGSVELKADRPRDQMRELREWLDRYGR